MKFQVEFKQVSGEWIAAADTDVRGMAIAYAKMTNIELGTLAIVRTIAECESEVGERRIGKVIASFGEGALPVDWVEFDLDGAKYRVDYANETAYLFCGDKATGSGAWLRAAGLAFKTDEARKAFWEARSKAVYA